MAAADTAIATRWGVSADVVEELRRAKLAEGKHWVRDGSRVTYTDAGISALRLALEIGPECTAEPAFYSLEIVRKYPNAQWVRVRLPQGQVRDVRVKSSTALLPRMRLRCRPLSDGRWECCQPGLGVALGEKGKEDAPHV